MYVTTQGEYGLRCMLAISEGYPDDPISISAIVEKENLPRAYVEQLVFRLRKAGLLESIRGTKGGYVLARRPEEVSVKDVLDVLEKGWTRVFCDRVDSNPAESCIHRPDCPLSALWEEVRAVVVERFSNTSLKSLLKNGYVPGGAISQVTSERT